MTDRRFLESTFHRLVQTLGNCGLSKGVWEGGVSRTPNSGYALRYSLHQIGSLDWILVDSMTSDHLVDITSSHRPTTHLVTQLEELKTSIVIDFRYIGGFENRFVPEYLNIQIALDNIKHMLDIICKHETPGFELINIQTRIVKSKLQVLFNYQTKYGHYQIVSLLFDVSQ